jgi:hypothetical protein
MKTGRSIQELAAEIARRADSKKDLVVNTANLSMEKGPFNDRDVELVVNGLDTHFGVNGVAHGQIGEHVEMPAKYYRKCLDEAPELLTNNINTWFKKHPAPRMVRTLDGNARALLSPAYRPLENENLAEAVLPCLLDMDLAIMSCEVTDTRLYIKAVDKKVERALANTGARFGDGGHTIVRVTSPAVTISNSEVGMGALSIHGGVYDSFCSNMGTFGERSLRKSHVGKRHELVDEELFAMLSDETRRKTDDALWAQVREVVKIAFDRAKFDALVDKIEGSQADKFDKDADVVKVVTLSSKRMGLNETEGKSVLKHLIEGGDLSRFGMFNAITRAAQDDAVTYDRATELERIGPQILDLPKSEWQQLAKAA